MGFVGSGDRLIARAFKKITSADDAREVDHSVAVLLYVFGGALPAWGALVRGDWQLLLGIPIYVGLAYWLDHRNSRVAATLLLALSLITTAATVSDFLEGTGGRQIIGALIGLCLSILAMRATYKLHARLHALERRRHDLTSTAPPAGLGTLIAAPQGKTLEWDGSRWNAFRIERDEYRNTMRRTPVDLDSWCLDSIQRHFKEQGATAERKQT